MKPERIDKVFVDGDVVAYRASFATQKKSWKHCEDALKALMSYIYGSTVVFPAPSNAETYLTGKGNYRFDIAVTQEYKGNRKGAEKPKHLEKAREYLTNKYGAVTVHGREADDAIATGVTSFGEPQHSAVASVDKDYLTVPGWLFDFTKGKWTYQNRTDALLMFYGQMLTGDRVDNIRGIHGIGPKKAEKILEGLVTEDRMWEAVLETFLENGETEDYLIETARLLHLQRYEGELWEPPYKRVVRCAECWCEDGGEHCEWIGDAN